MNAVNQDALRRYLLGAADTASAEEIEQRVFSNDAVFWERLSIAEDELIDDYAAGALDPDERRLFESVFLSTDDRRAKLEFARAILDYTRRQHAAPRGAWDWLGSRSAVPRWAVAAAAVIMVALVPANLWRVSSGATQPAVVAVSLAPGLLRAAGAETSRVQLPRVCATVRLDLVTGAGTYEAYSATVYDVSGAPVWAQYKLAGVMRDGTATVRLTVPCDALPEDDYWVRLFGIAQGEEPAPLDRYDFRVLRE